MLYIAGGIAALLLVVFSGALVLVVTPMPSIDAPRDVFGFDEQRAELPASEPPPLERFVARDGAGLAYRFYGAAPPAAADASRPLLIFVHGSSYHGGGYHALAESISGAGVADVLLPNLRGHHLSGRRRGDIDYIGQLEDDLADWIRLVRDRGHMGPIYLGGHSSGGGLVIRFGGGSHADRTSGSLLLSPVIPTAPTVKGGDAGGWASLNQRRLTGLLLLNAVGFRGLNGLPIIQFNKPDEFRDGTETLSYSYRLNTSYHPRYDYEGDIARMGQNVLVVVGQADEANDASATRAPFAEHLPSATIVTPAGIDHFGVMRQPEALAVVRDWLKAR